jgi:hypothetical protein
VNSGASFHALRSGHYRALARGVIAECGGAPEAGDLPFRLAESVINWRSDDRGCPPAHPWVIADGALRPLGFDGDLVTLPKLTGERLGVQPASSVTG